MKNPIRIGSTATALAAILTFGAPAGSFAATYFVDQNGAETGLWDGATTPILANLTTTTNWTTTAAGTATTVVFPAANNIQIGNTVSDFNGASIVISNNFNGNIGGNPASVFIVSTNVTVTWLGTSVNERFNHATIISVTNGSTLNFSGNNYNWNNQLYTLMGNGTMNFFSVLGNNDSTSGTGGFIMNMIGGTVNLYQTAIGTFGNAGSGGAGFTLTNGTLNFVSPQSFPNVFGKFQSSVSLKLNGGAMDNLSGAFGTIGVNLGSYSIGGNFSYLGSSQNMSLDTAAVTLAVAPQITVEANTLTIPGAVGDNGNGFGLTKAGNGILALTGANTYSGATTVGAGKLVVSTASTGNGSYTVGDNATLNVKVASLGQSLNMSSLTLGASSGGTLQFDVGLLGNPATAPINLGGGVLTVNGAGNQISFSSISAIPSYPITIPLIAYGSASGSVASVTLGALPPATPPYQGYLSNDSSGLYLVLTNGFASALPAAPKAVTWTGQTNGVNAGNWDTTTTNWISSGIATNYSNLTTAGSGDPVTFDDTLTGTSNVVLTTALSPASISLNNNNSNYVFSGSGRISGATALLMNGTGALIVDNSGNNDFSGGITVNSGTLQFGNNDTNGNPGTGVIANNGALVFSRSDSTLGTTTALGVISGSGSVTKEGSGTLTFNGIEPYTGPTVVNAGKLALSGPNANPSTLSSSSSLTINNGGTIEFQSDNVMGTTAPGVPVTINAGGVLTGLGTAGAGAGTSSHLRGLLTLNGGTLTMGGSQNNTSHGTWDLDGGVTVPGGSTTSTINTLNVIPNQGGGTIFDVTAGTTPSGIDLNITGSLINGSSTHDTGIIKNGNGVMVLDNDNTYALGTTINAGILQLGAAGDTAALTALGTGPVNITSGAVLKFASGQGITVPGVISDDGSGTTVLMSSGTNILTAANTYNGRTLVKGGTLALSGDGSINNSASIIISDATLDVSDSSGSVTSSGSLSLTNGTLTFPVIPGTPNITTTTLTTGGTTNVINLTAVPGLPVFPTNLTLIKYSAADPGIVDANNNLTTLGLVLPSLGSPVGYLTNNVANGSIDLVVLSDTLLPIYPLTWNGRTNGVNVGVWDILMTPDWVTTSDGVTPYQYQDASVVVFDDTAAGTTSVDLTTTVLPDSLTMNNGSKNYTFSGAGKISGATGLSKANSGTAAFMETGGDDFSGGVTVDAGTLILSNANANISGGMTVNGGSLKLQHSGIISGDLTLNSGSVQLDQTGSIAGNLIINSGTVQVGNNDANGVLPTGTLMNNDTLVFNRSDAALSVATVISGGGALTQNGPGTVTLTAVETYTGVTTVNGGILLLNGGNHNPSTLTASSALIINTNGTVQVGIDNSLAGSGAPGPLPVTINAGGLLTGQDGDANGTSTHIKGLLTLNGGTLSNTGTTSDTAHGSWNLDNGVDVNDGPNFSITSTIDCVSVIPTQAGGTSFNVNPGSTPSGIDLLVSGTFINGSSTHDTGIIKNGAGTMALANNNTYINGTTISAGTLQLGTASDANALTSPLGTGVVNINSSATLNFASSKGITVANAIGDDGTGLVSISSGTNVLTAGNSYSGVTVVRNSTLKLSGAGAINNSVSIVVSNATLDVSASSSPVASSGSLSLTGSKFNLGTNLVTGLGSLAISNATLTFPLNAATPNIMTTALTVGGTTNVINITSVTGLSVYPTNVTLIKYATANPGIVDANNMLTTLGVNMSGVGYLTNNVGNRSIDLVVVSVVNTNPATANFQATTAGGSMQFSWAPDHLGWQLYTNSVGLSSSGSWFPVPGSASVTNETITIDPANPNVFFQLRYP